MPLNVLHRQSVVGHAFRAAVNEGSHAHGGVVNSRHLVDEQLKPGDRIVVQGAFTLKAQALRGAVADPH